MTKAIRDMTASEPPGALEGPAGEPRGVAELIRHSAEQLERRAYRVVAGDRRGQIFFDRGRIVHAEFGEDFGLSAVMEMIRAHANIAGGYDGRWPAQCSVHLGPEVLLLVRDAALSTPPEPDTQTVRRVRPSEGPPPLPGTRAALPAAWPPPGAVGEPRRERSASAKIDALRSVVRASAGARPSSAPPPARADHERWGHRRSERVPAGSWRLGASASASEPPAAEARQGSSGARRADEVDPRRGFEPTTMVRLAPSGSILAARGPRVERLADAAAYLHELANAIASDLGHTGPAALHVSGEGKSLLVVRSEVGDIAAAMGATARLESLLRKAGVQ